MGKDKELRKIVFLDANVIISGTFFEGNESKLISLEDIDLYTSDIVVQEVKEVAIKKFKSLKTEDKRIALLEIERSLIDFVSIVEEKDYLKKVGEARKLIRKEKDSKILSCCSCS
jgi:predicted nucleic acid-binding protein